LLTDDLTNPPKQAQIFVSRAFAVNLGWVKLQEICWGTRWGTDPQKTRKSNAISMVFGSWNGIRALFARLRLCTENPHFIGISPRHPSAFVGNMRHFSQQVGCPVGYPKSETGDPERLAKHG
jgi:hypothetical protein